MLVLNVIGGLALLLHNGDFVTFSVGVLYLILFTPFSFLCWYRPAYKAFRYGRRIHKTMLTDYLTLNSQNFSFQRRQFSKLHGFLFRFLLSIHSYVGSGLGHCRSWSLVSYWNLVKKIFELEKFSIQIEYSIYIYWELKKSFCGKFTVVVGLERF